MYRVESPDQIAALESPVRQEIVDVLQANGASSIAEVAELLGRPADSLYYHVRHLEKVGLVREKHRRPARRRSEAVYELPGDYLHLVYDTASRKTMGGIRRIVKALLRLGERDFNAATKRTGAVGEGRDRNLWAARAKGWLTGAELIEVREHLEAINAILRRAGRTPDRRLHAVTWLMTPLASNSRNGDDKED